MTESDDFTLPTELPLTDSRPAESQDLRLVVTVLCHPNPARVGDHVVTPLSAPFDLAIGRKAPVFRGVRTGRREALSDRRLTSKPLRLHGTSEGLYIDRTAIPSRYVVQVGGEPLDSAQRLTSAAAQAGVVLRVGDFLILWAQYRRSSPNLGPVAEYLTGQSTAMTEVHAEIERYAELELPVLIVGETGCGKERAAEALHRLSGRRSGPLMAVNLGDTSDGLIAAEIFGVTAGAATGVKPRLGKLAQAAGGTLLLDEIGTYGTAVQRKLLRPLREGTYFQEGSNREERVDARLLFATNVDLDAAVREGQLQTDFVSRLRGLTVALPPIRDRIEDVPILFFELLRRSLSNLGKAETWNQMCATSSGREWPYVTAEFVQALLEPAWYDNVGAIERFSRVVIAHLPDGPPLRVHGAIAAALRAELAQPAPAAPDPAPASASASSSDPVLRKARRRIEAADVRVALLAADAKFGAAHALLGYAKVGGLTTRIRDLGFSSARKLDGESIEETIGSMADPVAALSYHLLSIDGAAKKLGPEVAPLRLRDPGPQWTSPEAAASVVADLESDVDLRGLLHGRAPLTVESMDPAPWIVLGALAATPEFAARLAARTCVRHGVHPQDARVPVAAAVLAQLTLSEEDRVPDANVVRMYVSPLVSDEDAKAGPLERSWARLESRLRALQSASSERATRDPEGHTGVLDSIREAQAAFPS